MTDTSDYVEYKVRIPFGMGTQVNEAVNWLNRTIGWDNYRVRSVLQYRTPITKNDDHALFYFWCEKKARMFELWCTMNDIESSCECFYG